MKGRPDCDEMAKDSFFAKNVLEQRAGRQLDEANISYANYEVGDLDLQRNQYTVRTAGEDERRLISSLLTSCSCSIGLWSRPDPQS